jgi:hypothetical protein
MRLIKVAQHEINIVKIICKELVGKEAEYMDQKQDMAGPLYHQHPVTWITADDNCDVHGSNDASTCSPSQTIHREARGTGRCSILRESPRVSM